MNSMTAAGTKLPQADYEALRWLAYKRHTTVSALIAAYVKAGLATEDLNGYIPPEEPT